MRSASSRVSFLFVIPRLAPGGGGQVHGIGCKDGLRIPSGGVGVVDAERSNKPRWWLRKPRNLTRLVIPRLI